MEMRERVLYHQVRAAKLATDIGTALVALWLLWNQSFIVALVVMFVPSIVVSALFVRFGHFDDIRDSSVGARLRARMSRGVEGLRFAGFFVAAAGAWFHVPVVIGGGLLGVALCWMFVMRRLPAP